MPHVEYPVTTGVRFLRDHGVPFQPQLYPYEEHGGTAHAAACLGVDEHAVIKTLVLETETRAPLLVLMHGDREVSTKALARLIGVKRVAVCDPADARRHTGYQVGGTGPFGTRNRLPVYVEESILLLDRIYLNGGKRGFLVEIAPRELERVLPIERVSAAVPGAPDGEGE
jgi:Cys-tRNA(Pro) deacylase